MVAVSITLKSMENPFKNAQEAKAEVNRIKKLIKKHYSSKPKFPLNNEDFTDAHQEYLEWQWEAGALDEMFQLAQVHYYQFTKGKHDVWTARRYYDAVCNGSERDTFFQVIDTAGNVVYSNPYLYKCINHVKKRYTNITEGKAYSRVEILGKVTPQHKENDLFKLLFPEFVSTSNGLFRRYVRQITVLPKAPSAIETAQIVCYIINSFHENHIDVL